MKLVRVIVFAIGTLLAAALVLAVALAVNGWNRLHQRQAHALRPLRVAPHDSLRAHGAHLARVMCASCHGGSDPSRLDGGGRDLWAGTGLGTLHAPDLTPRGVLASTSDEQVARAIREGVGRDDRALLGMPSRNWQALSDHDLAALIAFLRTQPPGQGATPRRTLTPLAYMLLGLRVVETSVQPPVEQALPEVPRALSADHGAYLAAVLGCRGCHGAALDGRGRDPMAPAGPALTQRDATLAAFAAAVREGRAYAGGRAIPDSLMPWRSHAHLDDTAVGALYMHLQALDGRR
jgi:cytochrome c553